MLTTMVAFLIAVPLVIGANSTGSNHSLPGCDLQRGFWCYWEVAYLFSTQNLLLSSEPGADKKYLTELCNRTILFPTQESCELEYAQCLESKRKLFESMERGYSTLQKAITNDNVCSAISHLNKCVNKKEMGRCRVHPQPEAAMGEALRRSNYEWSLNLSNCMERVLKKCHKDDRNVPRIRHLHRIMEAVIDLVRYDAYSGSVTRAPTEEIGNFTEVVPAEAELSSESTEETSASSTLTPPPTSTDGSPVSTLSPHSVAAIPAACGSLSIVLPALIISRVV